MSSLTQFKLAADTILVKRQLFESIKNPRYRHAFVRERVRSSIALQIRALREQRNKMTQKQLGELLEMAQTWISKLENPEYGKMTVATLLRLAEVFDADLEIKIRPFSTTIRTLPTQGAEYFKVPSFADEEQEIEDTLTREEARTTVATQPTGLLKQLATGTYRASSLADRLKLAEQAMSLGGSLMTLQQMAGGGHPIPVESQESIGAYKGLHLVPPRPLQQAAPENLGPSTETSLQAFKIPA